MPKFIKFLLVSVLLVGLLHTGVQACWNGFEHDKTNYRCWLFQPDLMPASVVKVLSYADFESDYDDYMSKSKSFRSRGNADTSFYVQNIEEWQTALAADPSVKSTKTVIPKDIQTVLYNLDPDDFFRKMDGDSLRNNTFIQAISASKSLMAYLNFAKICEQLMNFTDPWAEGYGEGKDEISLLRYSKMGDSVVKNTATSPFVRERTAYQMVKMAHYLGDTARVLALYKQFFAETASKSWVVGSASYYYAVAHSNPFEQNYLLSKTFENSIDKRWLSLRNFDQSDSILRGSLALTRNVHERATMLTLPILTNEGRTLPDLEKVYALEPKNPLLSMAIQREINKLEDWIYTNKFTEFSSSSKDYEKYDYDLEEKRRAAGITQKDIDAKNLRSDLAYLNDITAFVTRVATEGKRTDLAFFQLAAGHLAFLKKDFKTAKQFLAAAKTAKNAGNTPLSIQTQIWLTDLLCDLYAAEHLDANAEIAILKFDDFLKKQKNTLADYTTFRSQIMRFISERFISDEKMAKGVLILSKSTLTFGSINGTWEKNFYHKLLFEGTPQDIEDVIDIVSRKERKSLTPFERWLASEPKAYQSPQGCRGC